MVCANDFVPWPLQVISFSTLHYISSVSATFSTTRNQYQGRKSSHNSGPLLKSSKHFSFMILYLLATTQKCHLGVTLYTFLNHFFHTIHITCYTPPKLTWSSHAYVVPTIPLPIACWACSHIMLGVSAAGWQQSLIATPVDALDWPTT